METLSALLALIRFHRSTYHHKSPTLIPWLDESLHPSWDAITYQFQILNGATVEFWEWVGNSISYFSGHVIIYPCVH